MFRSAVALAAVIVAIAGCASTAPGATVEPTGNWYLTNGTDADGEFDLGTSTVTLQFVDAGRAGGIAACNHYGSDFTINGDTVRFGEIVQTEMYCEPDAVMQLESRYLAALTAVTSAEVGD